MSGLQHNRTLYYVFLTIGSLLFLWLVFLLGYSTGQSEFFKISVFYFSLFALFLVFKLYADSAHLTAYFISLAIFARVVLLFSLPNLSDDYLRFIWDGQLSIHHINPFGFLPSELSKQVFDFMPSDSMQLALSKNYYSVYPPVLQSIFSFSVWLSGSSSFWAVFIMKCFVLMFEIGSIILIIKILRRLSMPTSNVLWYALNPLPIIEYSGNLHFEAAMICFLLATVYMLMNHRLLMASLFFALAVSTKILPLMFLPFFWRSLGLKKYICLMALSFIFCIIFFLPFVNHLSFAHLLSSLGLYFNHFEFNASIYYILRWLELNILGYYDPAKNAIGLAMIVIGFILYHALKDKSNRVESLFPLMLFSYSCYYLLSSTVNPWYLGAIIVFSLFTRYKFLIIWPILSILSYHAYLFTDYRELSYLLWLEYLPVYVLIFIWYWNRKKNFNGIQEMANT